MNVIYKCGPGDISSFSCPTARLFFSDGKKVDTTEEQLNALKYKNRLITKPVSLEGPIFLDRCNPDKLIEVNPSSCRFYELSSRDELNTLQNNLLSLAERKIFVIASESLDLEIKSAELQMKLSSDQGYIYHGRRKKTPEEWLRALHGQDHVSLSSMDGTPIKEVNYILQLPEGDTPALTAAQATGYCRKARLVAPADFKLPLLSWDKVCGYCSIDKAVNDSVDRGSENIEVVDRDLAGKFQKLTAQNDSNKDVNITKENINLIGTNHYKKEIYHKLL